MNVTEGMGGVQYINNLREGAYAIWDYRMEQ